MLRMWERRSELNESVEDFTARVNADIDQYREAGLRVNYGVLADGNVFGQVGRPEPVRDPRTGMQVAETFVDLSVSEVLDARNRHEQIKAARAARPGRIIE